MTGDQLLALVVQAQAAPSVHNVQPARWRIEQDSILLAEDMRRRLAVGDPTGNDAAISLGAAAEGLRLAASLSGHTLIETRDDLPDMGAFRPVARYRPVAAGAADPLAPLLAQRASWRGAFTAPDAASRRAVGALSGDDCIAVTEPAALRHIARSFDRASYGFMREKAFRRELRGWMRLSRRNPGWARDGLNAQAMALSPIEALGAHLVLGPAFAWLDRLHLSASLLAEGGKIAGAAGVLLLHRPAGEDPFESGRRFHRLWLEIEAAGMSAAVLAALADDKETARRLLSELGAPAGNRLVSAFRVGRRAGPAYPRARLPVADILI